VIRSARHRLQLPKGRDVLENGRIQVQHPGQRRYGGDRDPAPKSPAECLCGAVLAHRPDRGHRPGADLRPAAPARRPGRVRPALQRAKIPTADDNCTRRAQTTPRLTSPKSGSSAGRSSAASSTGTNGQHESPCQLRVTQVWHPTGHDVTPIVLDVAANGRPPEDLLFAADVSDPLTGSSSWACGPAAKTFAAPWRARHRRGDHATCERLVGAPAQRAPRPCPDPRRGAPARRPGLIPSAHNKARPHQDIAQRASPMANTTVATSPPPTSAANGSTENSSSTA
jgi:hypothetical protein